MIKHGPKRSKYKESFSMDYREQCPHAQSVYPTQDTSRMGTAMVKEEEEADKNNARE